MRFKSFILAVPCIALFLVGCSNTPSGESGISYVPGSTSETSTPVTEDIFYYDLMNEGKEDAYYRIKQNANKCKNLKILVIPGSYNNIPVKEIGYCGFDYCNELETVIIEEGIELIESNAFTNCPKLSRVIIPNSILEVSPYAFDKNNNSIYTDFENGKYLGNIANPYLVYYLCPNLDVESISFANSTKVIVEESLSHASITSVTLPENLLRVHRRTFKQCLNLTSINFNSKITSIGYEAFAGCSSLDNVVIPESVISIDGCAFMDCTGLVNFTFGDNVTEIGSSGVFTSEDYGVCPNLHTTDYDGVGYVGSPSNPYLVAVFSTVDNPVIRDECMFVESIHTKDGSKVLKNCTLGANVQSLITRSFQNETLLEHITFNSKLTFIGFECFLGCVKLEEINLPTSLSDLQSEVFYGCSSIESIVIPSTIRFLSHNCFTGMASLQTVTFEENEWIEIFTNFKNCPALTSVTLPTGTHYVGTEMFGGSNALTSINYLGTMEQFQSLNFNTNLSTETTVRYVICSDGTINY